MRGDLPEVVEDARGSVYRLAALLGRGGQGAVYRTETPRRVVKLLDGPAPEAEALAARIRFVRRLDLDGLHIARPLELLAAPQVGYVMELLDDMSPLDALLKPEGDIAEWYISTGSVRRRLRLLAHVGEVLAGLHARGLAFVDPSPANAFVSTDLEHHEAWLIDADNLTVAGEGSPLYTRGYGAPELVAGIRRESTLSDAHALAVIVFQVLSLAHPLIGDAVDEGEPELEDDALAGLWPWIDHPDDDRNRSSVGIPRALVLSPTLRRLAGRAFGPGLADRFARPTARAWVDALHRAVDATVRCPQCEGTIYVNAPACAWCGAPAPAVLVGHLLNGWLDPEAEGAPTPRVGPIARGVIAIDDEPFTLLRRHLAGEVGPRGRQPIARLSRVSRGVELVALADVPLTARFGPARQIEVGPRPRVLPLDAREPWDLHLGQPSPSAANRVLQLHPFAEGQR